MSKLVAPKRKIGKYAKRFTGPSLTRQAEKDATDVNLIMKKYEKTGQLPEMIKQEPKFGDFSQMQDYHTSVNLVMKAEEQFRNLDAHVRKRFQNNPAEFLEFCEDPANAKEMIDLGLATAPPIDKTPDKTEHPKTDPDPAPAPTPPAE